MWESTQPRIERQIQEIRGGGSYKSERVLSTPQGARIRVGEGETVLNFCSNNYLGLSNHPVIVQAAREGLDKWGYGLSSVRFICGAQEPHKQLEAGISEFLGTEDTILYSSCFDANAGLFETILDSEDAVISDALNHASIIDGIRLSKAARFRYRNNDMADLEAQLVKAQTARTRLIATDGVFSMDGVIANLSGICDLAEKYNALVMVDDSHAVGFMGRRGRGTHEHCGVMGRVDILTGTLGKALGGASGGYTSGPKGLVDLLRQRSRPYLFSNSLAPPIVSASLRALEALNESTDLRDRLFENTRFFRDGISRLGLKVIRGEHPIVPVMLGDAAAARDMADALLSKGVYVIGFSYPVVPKGEARIRMQVSAAHTKQDLEFVLEKLAETIEETGLR